MKAVAWARPEDLVDDGHGHSFTVMSDEPGSGPARVPLFTAPEWLPIESMPAGEEVLVVVGGRVTVAIKSMGEYFAQLGMPDAYDRLPKCKPTLWQAFPLHPEA